jgi:Apea-like HEPN
MLQKKYYAIIKKKYKQNYKEHDIYNAFRLLLLIFPSDLNVSNEVYFSAIDSELRATGMGTSLKRYDPKYFHSHNNHLREVNRFLKKVFNDISKQKYIQLAFLHFITSFEIEFDQLEFLNLCMALEASVEGSFELSYRMKRGIAILIGENDHTCNVIFKNLGKIYVLRSAIVHGEEYDKKKLTEYLPYLRQLTARAIIELLLHKLERIKLNDALTKAGFGQRKIVSLNYKPYTLSLITQTNVNVVSLS